MKIQMQILILFVSIIFINCASSQSKKMVTDLEGDNLEFTADKQTAEMKAELKLTSAQVEKVKAINLKYLEKTEDLLQNTDDDRSAKRTIRTTIKKERMADLKYILSDSQFKKYNGEQSESAERTRGGRGGGRNQF